MKKKKIKTLPLPYLPHFHLHSITPSLLHASITLSHTKPPSLPCKHTILHQLTSATGLHTLSSTATPHASLHSYSTYPTAHTYSLPLSQPPLDPLTASTPHESASTAASACWPSHAGLPTPFYPCGLIFSFSRRPSLFLIS